LLTLSQGGAPVQTFTIQGYALRTTAAGLRPSTAYAYSATFEPGDHAQQGQPCTFTTPANNNTATPPPGPPPSTAVAPPGTGPPPPSVPGSAPPSGAPPPPTPPTPPTTPPAAAGAPPASSAPHCFIRLGPLCL